VRLGIDAPPDVPVFREEVYRRLPIAAAAGPARPDHLLRERLNGVALGLGRLRRQLQADATLQAWATLDQLEGACRELLALVNAVPDATTARPVPAAVGPLR
jgi:hypothetical protein